VCGIIGYVGDSSQSASRVLLRGLWRLEYRGYDSAGLATVDAAKSLHLRRTAGGAARLAAMVDAVPAPGSLGIAHTRWATHGRATEANAHPHLDATGRIALVHNGQLTS
jgi:glutamine---fructose-6-phosphate transaminase (isomerizing)